MKPRRAAWLLAALGALVALAAGAAQAHRGHESLITLSLQGDRVQGRWTIALHDLPSVAPGLDAAGNDEAALKKAVAARPALAAELLGRLRLAADGAPCGVTPLRHEFAARAGAAAWVVVFGARCPAAPARLTVDLRALFERDPKHLALLKLEAGAWVRAAMFTADTARQQFVPDQTVRPPSTGNSTPVMNAASSLPR